MSGLPISRLICSHDFFWSRKRQADVCRRCGALSPVLALHFRSRSAWTVGADLPPERLNGLAPAVDVGIEARHLLTAPEATSDPVIGPAVAALHEDQVPAAVAPASVPVNPFSMPAPSGTPMDFSNRAAAPLQRPLVT